MKFNTKFVVLFLLLISVFGCGSMRTNKDHYVEIDKLVNARSFDSAATLMMAAKDAFYGNKDRVLYWLDLGLLNHYKGDFTQSNQLLEKAEFAIDELYTSSVSKGAASMLLNDNALDYSGDDYENIYLNVFKCLNYIKLNSFDEAFVEVRRINDKLTLLSDKYQKIADSYNESEDKNVDFKPGESKFHNSALGRYLSMLIYRTEGNFDAARIDKEKICEAFKLQNNVYDFPIPQLDSSFENNDSIRINFISMYGKAPEKFAYELTVHADSNIIYVSSTSGKESKEIDRMVWPGVNKDLHFKLSLPYMEKKPSKVAKIEVLVDGITVGCLQKIESLENVALDTYKLKEPIIYLKSLTRTVLKAMATHAANKELDKTTGGGFLGSLTRAVTGAIMDATENADLRTARYFPSIVSIGEVKLLPGEHTIMFNYFNEQGLLLFSEDLGKKDIKRGSINLFESFYLN